MKTLPIIVLICLVILLPTSWAQTTAMTTASRTQGVAPLAVFFDAVSINPFGVARPFHDLKYEWDFGDPTSGTWATDGKSKNKATGAVAAHVFENNGTYTVRLNISDGSGTIYEYEQIINVDDPDTVFSGQNTICYSSSGNFNSCPSGALQRTSGSFNSAMTELFASNGPRRVLFKAGERFNASMASAGRTGPFYIGKFGSGENPVIYGVSKCADRIDNDGDGFIDYPLDDGCRSPADNKEEADQQGLSDILYISSNDLVVADLTFMSGYDAATGLGEFTGGLLFWNGAKNVLMFRNEFTGLAINLGAIASNPTNLFIVENDITNWYDYGVFSQSLPFATSALLGNKIMQNPDAVSGINDGKCPFCYPTYADHGPIRIKKAEKLVISNNILFSNTGWWNEGKGHNPAIRLPSGGYVDTTIVSDNTLEGGIWVVHGGSSGGDTDETKFGNIVWERNKFIATSTTDDMIVTGIAGQTFRNNLFIKPNNGGHPGLGTGKLSVIFYIGSANGGGWGHDQSNLNIPIHIQNNIFISFDPVWADAVNFIQADNGAPPNYTIHNNLVYAPLITQNTAAFLRWLHTSSDVRNQPINNNMWHTSSNTFAHILGTDYSLSQWQSSFGKDTASSLADPKFVSTDPASADFLKLQSTSPAIDTGASLQSVFEDYDGNPRPQGAGWDIGAYEFSSTSLCIDMPSLLNYISQWKNGAINMTMLMQKIKDWKTGTGC